MSSYELGFAESESRGLAILLSGLRYSCERPLLAGAADALAARGYDIFRAEFGYADDPEFAGLSEAGQLGRIEADGLALLDECLALSPVRPLTIIGKSLGTIAMGGMMGARDLPEGTHYVWLTPSLAGTNLMRRMERCPGPSFSLIGSRDPSVPLTRQDLYRTLPGMTHVEVEGADHGWTHPDGDAATARIEAEAKAALVAWLDAGRAAADPP